MCKFLHNSTRLRKVVSKLLIVPTVRLIVYIGGRQISDERLHGVVTNPLPIDTCHLIRKVFPLFGDTDRVSGMTIQRGPAGVTLITT